MTFNYFPEFRSEDCVTAEITIRTLIGGKGPPLLLLHGWPQTHLEWHHIAPRLARDFTVVMTDLRGYGDSGKPADGDNHSGYSKRSMAADQVAVMRQLGFEKFAVVGHDRGGRVAHRMALDHPECVSRVAVIDIVPTLKLYTDVGKEFATAYFHWFFLIQPAPLPETLLANNIEFFLRGRFRGLSEQAMPETVFQEYVRCMRDPATLHAMCEDYRAAASIDLEHDKADLDKKVRCPLLAIWGEHGAMRHYDVPATWRERAMDVRGQSLPGGHWLPEQLPDALYSCLHPFLAEP